MPEIELKDIHNQPKGMITLPSVFGYAARKDILHTSVKNYLANNRQGTHATKTRGLVSGGGKKPWRQKHTGKARAGSIRSPLWRKGGTIFGPQPREYGYSLIKSLKRRALGEALSAKFIDNEVLIVNSITIQPPKTKQMVAILKNLGILGKSTLIVLHEKDENIMLSSRNIPGVETIAASDLNPYVLLTHTMILFTRDAIEAISRVHSS
jgi:large subunit ribosomal protein L4